MEIRDILKNPDKERTYAEFIVWIDKVVADVEKNATSLCEEYFLKLKDSQKEDIAKKFREEICPLALLLKNYKNYFGDTTIKYNIGDDRYDVILKKDSETYYIEIVTASEIDKILRQDRDLFANGFSASHQISVDSTIELIKKYLKHKINKRYIGKYVLLIGIDDMGFSRTELKKDLYKKIKKIVWDKGNFLDVFVVGTWQCISIRL